METPSSMRIVTRSQARTSSQKKVAQEHTPLSRGDRNHERTALLDVSNDSPIIGLAMEKTPLSSFRKHAALSRKTPGSGEALLRQQVKILLEKVDETAELFNNHNCTPFFPCSGTFPISPGLLAAPTPANTPQLFTFPKAKEEAGEEEPYGFAMKDVITVLPEVKPESVEHVEQLTECVLNRALEFDSPSKSDVYDAPSNISSSVSYQGSIDSYSRGGSSSNWSTQVNASANVEDEFEKFDEEDADDEGCLNELCERIEKIMVEEEKKVKKVEFTGKHVRFLYNSDDEIETEEEVGRDSIDERAPPSPSVTLLKGLPVPEGKHLRFHEDYED